MKKLKLYKEVLGVLIVSSLIITACNAMGAQPAKTVYKMPLISDVKTVTSFSKKIPNSSRDIHVSLLYESDRGKALSNLYSSHDPRYVERIVVKTSHLMTSFLRDKRIDYGECRGYSYNLIILIVSKSVLQDDNRFREFYRTRYGVDRMPLHTLYGYYDSTPEVENNSSMLLTDISKAWNEEVFAHELAHYWWDRLCVKTRYKGSSEDFATEFQKYYMRRR